MIAKGTGKNILDKMRLIMNGMGNNFELDGNVRGEALTAAVAKAMVDSETGQRGFLITGEDEFLEPFNAGTRNVTTALAALRNLVDAAHDRVTVTTELNTIERLGRQWLREAGKPEIELRRQVDRGTKTQADIEQTLIAGKGKATLDEIRRILGDLESMFAQAANERGKSILVSIAKAMVDQETGQRGFLITGKEEFLEPFESGQEEFQVSIKALRSLNSQAYDIPLMKRDIDSLTLLSAEWLKKAARPEIAARREMKSNPRWRRMQAQF